MAIHEDLIAEITLEKLESVPQYDSRLHAFIHALTQRLLPLVESGERALRRKDEAKLLEIDRSYREIRGEGGHPADIRPFLDFGSGRRFRTAKLAVAGILEACRPDLGQDRVRRYRYPLRNARAKKRG
jgi:hypothetical protein